MTADVDLSCISEDSEVPIFQRSKYLLLATLSALPIEGRPPEMTAKQLYEWVPLSMDGVSSCLYRMSKGYSRPGIPYYKRIYIKRIPTLRGGSLYRLLEKGQSFLFRMNKERPRDTSIWLSELVNYRQMKRSTQQMTRKSNTEDGQNDE